MKRLKKDDTMKQSNQKQSSTALPIRSLAMVLLTSSEEQGDNVSTREQKSEILSLEVFQDRETQLRNDGIDDDSEAIVVASSGSSVVTSIFSTSNENKKTEEEIICASSSNSSSSISTLISNMEARGDFKSISIRRTMLIEPIPFSLPQVLKVYNPRPTNLYFVPRSRLMLQLAQAFGSDDSTQYSYGLCSVVLSAFHGLSGVGKTQLALHYFNEPQKSYNFKAWFQADTQETLQREYLSLAYEAGLIESDKKAEEMKPEVIVRRVKDWLSRNPGWLLIYDNAQNYEAIKEFLPAQGGDVLITSKSGSWIGQHIFVSVMELDEAIALVKNIYEPTDDSEDNDIIALVEKLGRLPLAIAQAAAYLKAQRQTVAAYLLLYDAKRTGMLSDDTLRERWSKKEHEPVAVTWLLTIAELRKTVPDSETILQFCAYFANRDIPYYILRACLYEASQNEEEKAEQQGEKRYPQQAFWQLLTVIRQYSLLEINSQQETVNIHQLVQGIIQDQLSQETQQRIVLKSVNVIDKEYAEKELTMADIKRRKNLILHMESIKQHSEMLFIDQDKATQDNIQLPLLVCLAEIYGISGDVATEIKVLKQVFTMTKQNYGVYHVNTAITLHNLANAYGAFGNVPMKKKLLKQVLNIRKTFYREQYIEVANTLINLGAACLMLGEMVIAKKYLEEAVLCLNDDHPYIICGLTNLASTYHTLGDLINAKKLLKQALKIVEKLYDKQHVDTAVVLGSLALVYGDLGNAKKMKELLEQVLIIQEGFYGKNHSEVMRTLGNLANAYGELKDMTTKKKLLKRALAIGTPFYGEHHVEVAKIIENLANAYGCLKNSLKQKTLLKQALTIFKQFYGEDHIEVANTLYNLANTYGNLGNIMKQKALLEQIVPTLEQFYGENIKTATAMCSLANVYGVLEDTAKQKTLLEKALTILKKFYGESHVKVAKVLAKLADAYRNLGNVLMQKASLEQALAILKNFYGEQHVKTINVSINLGATYLMMGDPIESKLHFKQALPFLKEFYGEYHGQVGITLYNLATADCQTQDYFSAFQISQQAKEILLNAKGFGENHPWTKTAVKFANYLEQHVTSNPEEAAKAYHHLACRYHMKGDIKKANATFKKAMRTTPNSGIYCEYGHFLLMQNRHSDAIEELFQATKLANDKQRLSYGLSEKPCIEANLQREVDLAPDNELSIDTALLSHYLLVIADHKQHQQRKESRDNTNSTKKVVNIETQRALWTFIDVVEEIKTPLACRLLYYVYRTIREEDLAIASQLKAKKLADEINEIGLANEKPQETLMIQEESSDFTNIDDAQKQASWKKSPPIPLVDQLSRGHFSNVGSSSSSSGSLSYLQNQLTQLCRPGDMQRVKSLLSQGASPILQDSQNEEPLVVAIIGGSVEIFKALEKAKQDGRDFETDYVEACVKKVLELRKQGEQFEISEEMLTFLSVRGLILQVQELKASRSVTQSVGLSN
jgi:tetratricopeptide (TPR) repeat protein